MNKQEQSPLLTLSESAQYIRMSESWMKQNPNVIPYVRLGAKAKRWRKSDLDKFIESNLRGALHA